MFRISPAVAFLLVLLSQSCSAADETANLPGRRDWSQWGGSSLRNNVSDAKKIPIHWNVGRRDAKTGLWKGATNVKWVADIHTTVWALGLASGPVVAGGKVFIGSNNYRAYLKRFKNDDLATLLCFREQDGAFLWQYSSPRLSFEFFTGCDWDANAMASAPYVEGERLWLVTNRCEVVCLDTEGFLDGENDGPFQKEEVTDANEADVIWKFNMLDLHAWPHNAARCCITAAGDALFVCTSNGIDMRHQQLPSPEAPSFLAMDKNSGRVLWSDASPGENILHGQWSSPAYGVLGGVPQVIFGGGDGWLYSFDPQGEGGHSKLLWKFDCNPKTSAYAFSRSTRNAIVAAPMIQDGLVYVAVGEDGERGEGDGHLWCIDPTKRGDVSVELVFNAKDPDVPIPHKRLQACVKEDGDFTRHNPNSAAVWHFDRDDLNGNGRIEFEETMHRTCSSPAIADGLLFLADFSGLVHCVDAKTGKQHWAYDLLAPCTASPLIVDGHVFVADEDGDVAIFGISADPRIAMNNGAPLAENNVGTLVETTPIAVNETLYIAARHHLFAISADGK